MNRVTGSRLICDRWLMVIVVLLAAGSPAAFSSTEHPLEPPDRSSPRATLTTFLDSIDRAWALYSVGDPGLKEPLRDARECLDLSEIPPLVLDEASAEVALSLKEVLDRIELPDWEAIPDRATVAEIGLTRWTIPHTEIQLVQIEGGDRQGQWQFSIGTVQRATEFYEHVRHLPYRPGRSGGHLDELRAGSEAVILLKLVAAMPPWFRSEIAGIMAWQWLGLVLLVVLLGLGVALAAWVGRRWHSSSLPGKAIANFLAPAALVCVPFFGRFMIARLFTLPGMSALVLRLALAVVAYVGLAWLVAVALMSVGDLTVRFWFKDARPLKKQLVREVFRIATFIAVVIIALKAAHVLGVPVAGLVAGLGVGGLAIALAAQGTLENFIGGIILYADQPVKVGDLCVFGDHKGTVEEVGLRSVRIRTRDRTVVTVPNGQFSRLHLENLSKRDRMLLREQLRLRYETTREQLVGLLSELDTMLREHPRIADERLRVRLTGFRSSSIEVELFCYALTRAWPECLEIREDVLLKAMEIVERSGTRLALPTEVHYTAGQTGAPDEQGSGTSG